MSIATKLRYFQYRIVHYILTTNTTMCKWGKRSNDLCSFCNKESETIEHLLWDCNTTKILWFKIIQWIHDQSRVQINITRQEVLLGILTEDHFHMFFNTIALIVKQYVYVCRCLSKTPNFTECKSSILKFKYTEECVAKKNSKMVTHNNKWQFLM